MLIGWKHIVVLMLAGAITAFVIAWAGLVGVGASTGHWKATDWFLHWVMRSSVRTAAIGTKAPELTPGMLPMAAGHFETGCAICHGSPAMARPDSVRNMLPPPPDLKEITPTWSDAELFQIVQHGVRFTGMPAWPAADREDESWAMVAFLRRYPDLDAENYRALAGYSASQSRDLQRIIGTCNGCHAPDRIGNESLIPRLGGQSAAYIQQSLKAYTEGTRQSGVMAVATQSLDDVDMKALATHFAGQPAGNTTRQGDPELIVRGRALAGSGDPARGIPACLSCHEREDGNPAYPHLSGQPAAYLENQLRLFADNKRGGGPYRDLMARAAENLKPEDIAALAAYFAAEPASTP